MNCAACRWNLYCLYWLRWLLNLSPTFSPIILLVNHVKMTYLILWRPLLAASIHTIFLCYNAIFSMWTNSEVQDTYLWLLLFSFIFISLDFSTTFSLWFALFCWSLTSFGFLDNQMSSTNLVRRPFPSQGWRKVYEYDFSMWTVLVRIACKKAKLVQVKHACVNLVPRAFPALQPSV